ncbi:glycosyl hydrolase 2 galactose-binding domain-containing protein [Paenibacillus alkalitolerans]|uniref:glycosyl hydrolase 2 galactose-binding domain-containing protein n=1 Tax=Paenibacillus alkalitolerans TaxID=2799335 RepID=UPI0018F6397A|nr:glycoside hydrolase family 2 TIM barrel-domain containing protein [Paenibacillus alkalitolerans]
MEQDTQLDQFAEIAFREHPEREGDLQEISPVYFEKNYFVPCGDKAPAERYISHEERIVRFQAQLNKLREEFRPYMRDLTTEPEIRRDTLDISEFQFRYRTPGGDDFRRVLEGEGDWETVTVPDFRGPTGENGKWSAYYRTQFAYGPIPEGKRVYLVFKGIDYKASVYVNGKCVGSHEGFFAPFEFDVTELLRNENSLVVEVSNDYPMMGVGGTKLDGDKIYAATGPGWDDPYSGWHHCPPGGGIYNKVFLEQRSELFIQDIFVRPNIDDGCAEVWADIMNTANRVIENIELQIEIMPKNFTGENIGPISFQVAYAGPGINYCRYRLQIPSFRLWEPESPYLYTARVSLQAGTDRQDVRDRHFGMRKFLVDEYDSPKGTLYLNNRPVILRGANEMGHLQQCVMNQNYEQLIDDILIAKIANMNYYRITQRPVQEEIYDYFDMLGMMHQCDLPTFGFIRRNQFSEAVRQAAEMERLIRSHPSAIMVSLINEPSRTEKRRKGHRHLHRDELEAFFVAARQAIYIENPDRAVKNAEGDYNPPTREGLPDFHCYNMWYTDNVIPVGKMYKGFLPSIKPDWKTGCGEYGTEGLDNIGVMMKHYPKEWLPAEENEPWTPDKIVGAQTYGLHGDWFAEQSTLADWVRESQKHQCLATKLMTDAWRRRADYIVSTAIHLLIDAWPSGWMKALVGADRNPKPAFFTYQACLEPVRVNLRCDRWRAYEGETLEIEAWLLNDTHKDYDNCRVIATLRDEDREYGHYAIAGHVERVSSRYAGTIRIAVPAVQDRSSLYVDACLVNDRGERLNSERFAFEAFPKAGLQTARKVAFLGGEAERVCSLLQLDGEPFNPVSWNGRPLIVSSGEEFARHQASIVPKVKEGASVLLIRGGSGTDVWDIDGSVVKTVPMKGIYVLAVNRESPRLQWMNPDDLSYFYHVSYDRIGAVADCWLEGAQLEPVAFTYRKRKDAGGKGKLPVVGKIRMGKGEIVIAGLPLSGRNGFNPTLDLFLVSLLGLHDTVAVAAAERNEGVDQSETLRACRQ